LAELKGIIDTHQHTDIGKPNYSITDTLDYKTTHGVDHSFYRQVLIQSGGDGMAEAMVGQAFDQDEFVYSDWNDEYDMSNTRNDLLEYFTNVCRFRLSELQPHSEIKWHIDTNTSVACRAQICVNSNDSIFEFKNKKGVHQLYMKPGELWFINTAYPHRVVSNEDTRQTAIFTFKFADLKHPSGLYQK
jgi:hypothetical protein